MATALRNLRSALTRHLFICCGIVFCLQPSTQADRDTSRSPDTGNRLHGPLEFLNDSLDISSRSNRLLNIAIREIADGHKDTGFQALLEIFSSQDVVVPPVNGVSPGSSYQQAFDLLAKMDSESRAVWVQSVEPAARLALQQANGDGAAMALVARRFPFTPSGIQALTSQAFLARSRGQHHLAMAMLRKVQSMSWSGGDLFTNRETDDSGSQRFSNMAGQPSTQLPSQLGLPWPEPKWQWGEQLWDHPEAIAFSPLLAPTARRMLSLNSWRPTLFGDTIYMKTPFHVIAFHKSTGRIEWSLTTDTMKQNTGPYGNRRDDSASMNVNLADVLRRDSMGTVAVSDDFVFFVDHFRVFDFGWNNSQFGNGGQIQRWPLQRGNNLRMGSSVRHGTRLVAVRRTPHPRVAWAIGDGPEYEYDLAMGELSSMTPTAALSQTDSATKTNRSGSLQSSPQQDDDDRTVEFQRPATGEFAGQHFCGVPVVHDQMLFVISQDTETYWLNCLSEATGRLQWKQILAHINNGGNQPGRFLASAESDYGASLCGVVDDVVVCALHNGMVIGSNIIDGQFLWATNLRDDLQTTSQTQVMNLLARTVNQPAGIRSQPILQDDRLYWAAPFSTDVHCVDTITGERIWQVPGTSTGIGRLEGSVDRYVAGVTKTSVILIGVRHVRAVDIRDGSELWATPIIDQTGKAFCNEVSCLVPLVDGSLGQISLADGSRNTLSESIATNDAAAVGAIVADDEVICLTTPLSISVSEVPQSVSKDSGRSVIDQATANILAGNIADGLASLQRLSADQTAPQRAAKAGNLLTESLLSLHDGPFAKPLLSQDEIVQRLAELPMTPEQTVRKGILFGTRFDDSDAIDFADQLPTLKLAPDWTARADVAAWNHLSFKDAQQVANVNDNNRSVYSRLEHAILYPDQVGSLDQKMTLVRQLLTDQRYAAAELLLLSARNDATASNMVLIDNEIRRLRSEFSSSLTSERRTEISSVEFVEQNSFSTVSAIALLRDRIRMHVDSPQWYPSRLFVSGRSLISASMDLGVETSELQLPESPNDSVQMPDTFETPSILPITGADSVGVVSLLDPDGPQVLWWRRFQRKDFDVSPIEVGPFGPSFVMVSIGTEFLCLHPLTGKELWRRQTSDDISRHGMLDRFPRLVGNENVMARFGQRLKSYELFRTQDGKMLDTVAIDIPDGQTPLSSGHSVLYLQNRRLVLQDLLTQKDLLADRPPITLMGAGQAVLLKDHRAITLNDDMELLVLNLRSGDIETRCSVAEVIDRDKIVGIKAFERNGSLFVVLKDWNSSRSSRRASSRMGEVKLESGLLCRVDPKSGQLLWQRQIEPCVAPTIYGAETNLMVTWCWKSPVSLLEQRLGGRGFDTAGGDHQGTLEVVAINLDTGETVNEASHLNPAEPVRCVHDDGQKLIRLESDSSVIELKYN